MENELTPQDWAELANELNYASYAKPALVPLRDKVRAIARTAILRQFYQASAGISVCRATPADAKVAT